LHLFSYLCKKVRNPTNFIQLSSVSLLGFNTKQLRFSYFLLKISLNSLSSFKANYTLNVGYPLVKSHKKKAPRQQIDLVLKLFLSNFK